MHIATLLFFKVMKVHYYFFVFVVTLALTLSPCLPAHKQTCESVYHDGVLIIDNYSYVFFLSDDSNDEL